MNYMYKFDIKPSLCCILKIYICIQKHSCAISIKLTRALNVTTYEKLINQKISKSSKKVTVKVDTNLV